jgi:hypothetical protein
LKELLTRKTRKTNAKNTKTSKAVIGVFWRDTPSRQVCKTKGVALFAAFRCFSRFSREQFNGTRSFPEQFS